MNFIRQLNFHLIQLQLTVRRFLEDRKGELDEKAILIAFFVIVVAAAVVLLGTRVGNMFRQLANMV
jgi:Flp pilus assembly pilin Flp